MSKLKSASNLFHLTDAFSVSNYIFFHPPGGFGLNLVVVGDRSDRKVGAK